MTDGPKDRRQERQAGPPEEKERSFKAGHRDEIYEFRDSTIRERHGYYPLWLTAVAIVLILWSVWYSYNYWGPPH